MRPRLGIVAALLLVLAPCGSFAKDPALLSLGMEHFRDTASVAVDAAQGLTTISTEPGFVEHSGLMAMVWHDEFLTAVIDAKTGRASFAIDISNTYSGARRSYLTASLAGMQGPAAVVPTLVKTESANCSVGECIYTDHLVIPVDEALLRRLAAGYVPGKPMAFTFTLTPKRGADYRGELSNAEVAGLLARLDAYWAAARADATSDAAAAARAASDAAAALRAALEARTASLAAPPSPRRLEFGISGIEVSPSADMPNRAGVLVSAVRTESVAQRAGIITGDIVYQVGDRPTRSLGALEAAVDSLPASATVSIRLYRGLNAVTLEARF
jgi:hypothetical protein